MDEESKQAFKNKSHVSPICGTQNDTNELIYQTQTTKQREQICSCKGKWGVGNMNGSLGLAVANYYTENG